jgi:hypothetical protein
VKPNQAKAINLPDINTTKPRYFATHNYIKNELNIAKKVATRRIYCSKGVFCLRKADSGV